MKGIVFTLLNEVVEENFGYEIWDQVLEIAKVKSSGVYTSSATYPESELTELITALSQVSKIPQEELVTSFGYHSLSKFHTLFPQFFEVDCARDFLKGIHCIVHVQVNKLYSDTQLPTFEYEDPGDDRLIMKYRSPRKLCRFATGLITATGEHFNTTINHNHTKCLHNGHDHCRFELDFKVH